MIRVQFVKIYSNILRDGRVCRFRLRPDGCNESFRQHGCGWCESAETFALAPLYGIFVEVVVLGRI
jgi:hypothetical protein